MAEDLLLRFTILEHNHPFLHWDLLMQNHKCDSLHSWRLLQKPTCGTWIASEPLPDHRIMYLDYEGPVSSDRGTVSQFSSGQFYVDADSSAAGHTVYQLIGCDTATKLLYRDDGQSPPAWRFE